MKHTIIKLAAAAAGLASIGTMLRVLSYGVTPARDGLYGPAEFGLLAGAAAAFMALSFAVVSWPRR